MTIKTKKLSMAKYVQSLLPKRSWINFIFQADFSGNGATEAVVGYSNYNNDTIKEFSILYVKRVRDRLQHQLVLTTRAASNSLYGPQDGVRGDFAGSFAVDTNGDGKPELVLALVEEPDYHIRPYVFHWLEGTPVLVWRGIGEFCQGAPAVVDDDGDGVFELHFGETIRYSYLETLPLAEISPHTRVSHRYKWDGSTYVYHPHAPESLRDYHQVAEAFLLHLWQGDDEKAYQLAQLPALLGLDGLDDSSLGAFRHYVNQRLKPALLRIVKQQGTLKPAYWCVFCGGHEEIVVLVKRDQGQLKVAQIGVYQGARHLSHSSDRPWQKQGGKDNATD